MQQGLENGEEKEARLARRRLIINMLRDTATNGECSNRATSLWGPEPERSAWLDQITLVSNSYKRATKTSYHTTTPVIVLCWQYNVHHPDSIPHSWQSPDSTAVCAQQIVMHYKVEDTGNQRKIFAWTKMLQLFEPPPLNALRPATVTTISQ